ncbi:MAG: sterol desaturase family protein, partial [Pseudomonadota bacterium]
LIADIAYYWEHRIAHQVRLLWTQHAVHHSSRDMNMVTGIRFGPFEGLWSLIIHLPMAFMGFAPEAIVLGVVTVLAYQTWLHTELIGKLGKLEWVLNTPSHHRVHHGCDAKYLDRNYGGILIVWDRLWGTFQAEQETPRYGLARDFHSRNPVRVWFSEIPALIKDLSRANSLSDAFGYLFRKLGWTPKND